MKYTKTMTILCSTVVAGSLALAFTISAAPQIPPGSNFNYNQQEVTVLKSGPAVLAFVGAPCSSPELVVGYNKSGLLVSESPYDLTAFIKISYRDGSDYYAQKTVERTINLVNDNYHQLGWINNMDSSHRLNSFLLKFIPNTTYAPVDKIELSFQSTKVVDGKILVDNNNGMGYVFESPMNPKANSGYEFEMKKLVTVNNEGKTVAVESCDQISIEAWNVINKFMEVTVTNAD